MIKDEVKRKAYQKAWREANKDKVKEYRDNEDKDKRKAYMREYYRKQQSGEVEMKRAEKQKEKEIIEHVAKTVKQWEDSGVKVEHQNGVMIFTTMLKHPCKGGIPDDFDKQFRFKENELERQIKSLLPWRFIYISNISHNRINIERELYIQADIRDIVRDMDREIVEKLKKFDYFQ